MHPQQQYAQQPYGQPAPQVPHQQPNPYQPYAPQGPAPAQAGPRPSAITAITAAVLGVLVAFAWVGGAVGTVLARESWEVGDLLGATVTGVVVAVPGLVGAIATFARTKFGRVVLIVGLSLPLPMAVVLTIGPDVVVFGTSVLVCSIGGIVLACSPTTGRYIRAAKRYTSRPGPYPSPQAHPRGPYPQQPAYPQQAQYPQQAYPQQPAYPQQAQYPQAPYLQQPGHPQQGMPPGH